MSADALVNDDGNQKLHNGSVTDFEWEGILNYKGQRTSH
jgi:hypothetical protein